MQVAAWCPDVVWAKSGEELVYSVYGITVRSDFELSLPRLQEPARAGIELRAESADFFQALKQDISFRENQSTWSRYGVLPDGASYLLWPNIFECLVSHDGRAIHCGWLGAETTESLQVYLLGAALGHALVHQGEEPLHATVVIDQGKAIALLGNCGFGKSTLAAYLLDSGARLLTDDLLRLDFCEDGIRAYPGPQRIKLLPGAAAQYLRDAGRGVKMNPYSGKYVIPLPEQNRQGTKVRLDTLYLLDWPAEDDEQNGARSERMSQRDTFLAVTGSTFNLSIRHPARLARQFQFANALASRIPCYRLSYPRRFEVMPQLRKLIFGG
jgi:hypothetical protein